MGVNRFYTPSLPQYTSQFVEDKTPWESIIGFEQEKLQRGEKALAYAAETDALTGSLTPGYRTQDIAPEVTQNYKQKMDKWMQDYGESSYSIPALRALTKINAEFHSDPNVKLIQQDREASGLYEQMRRGPNYRPETDPNIDSETGQIEPFSIGDTYRPYATPIEFGDLAGSIRERYSTLKTEVSSAPPVIVSLTGSNGELQGAMRERNISKINPETLKQTKEALIQGILKGDDSVPGSRYQKAIAGKSWNEDYVRRMVEEESKPFAQESYQDNYSWEPNRPDKSVSTAAKKDQTPYSWNLPTAPYVERVRPWSEEGKGDIGRIASGIFGTKAAIANTDANVKYYNEVRDNPEKLIQPDTKSNVGLGVLSNALITKRLVEDPAGTKAMFDNYFKERLADKSLGFADKNRIKNDMEKTNSIINNFYEKVKIDESPVTNEIDWKRLQWAALNSPDFKNSGFKDKKNLLDTRPEKLTASQKIWLRANERSVTNRMSKSVGWSKVLTLPDDVQTRLQEALGGQVVNNDGVLTVGKAASSIFKGSRLVDPQDPNKEFTDKERDKILNEKEAFYIDGYIPDQTSQYGPGMLAATIGGKNYYIQGPDQFVDGHEIEPAAYSFKAPNAGGQGDIFTIRNIDPSSLGVKAIDRWSKDKAGYSQYDTYMQVIDDPRTGFVSVISYTEDPTKPNVDPNVLNPRNDDNPKGYSPPASFGYKITDEIPVEDMRYMIQQVYLQAQQDKGEDVGEAILMSDQAFKYIKEFKASNSKQ